MSHASQVQIDGKYSFLCRPQARHVSHLHGRPAKEDVVANQRGGVPPAAGHLDGHRIHHGREVADGVLPVVVDLKGLGFGD